MYMFLVLTLITGAIGTKNINTCDSGNNKPIKCGYNEEYVKCKTTCPPQSCDISYTDYLCGPSTCEGGCDCIKDHLRNASNICIPNDDCPPPPIVNPEPECGINEILSDCKIVCPPQTCESVYTLYACDGPERNTCETGCNCIAEYLRDANNTCIPSEQCSTAPTQPECGQNEVYSDCMIVCPPQTCASIGRAYACDGPIRPCISGCNCIEGYLRNDNNICIPMDQCSQASTQPECGQNEVYRDCKTVCPPQTCASIGRAYACDGPERPCISGCNCIEGYLRDANNFCIPMDQCSQGPPKPQCGPNEVASDCKITCPPQKCSSLYSKFACLEKDPCESGCNCIDGYLRDDNNVCIPGNKCPGVSNTLCRVNETFVDCAFRCPNQNCPADDSLFQIACKPGRPCPSGCACQDGYLRKSDDDDTCILASDCPPVECTRPNEVWDPCSSDCLVERCEEVSNQQSGCEAGSNCRPRCVCKKNFCRNNDDVCVPLNDCTNGPDCEPTCDEPNPPNCPSITKDKSTKIVTCQDGFILSKKGGKCVRIEDCPSGNPCSVNETFVACKAGCPTDYCPIDDSRATVVCETFPFSPCISSCVCKLNHKKLSAEDDRCIVSSECPPVDCTRPNEEWNPCPSECLGEFCDSANKEPVTCNTLVLNCQPKCTCKKNYFRNTEDICIPAADCPQN